MDGRIETDPSKVITHCSGDSGVITSRPHPQAHKWVAVEKGADTYRTPGSSSLGKEVTNSATMRLIFGRLLLFACMGHLICQATVTDLAREDLVDRLVGI